MNYDFPHKQKIMDALLKAVPSILKIFLFGSRVGAQNINPQADIDIGIVCEQKLSLPQLAKIEDALDQLDTLHKIDVVDFTERNDDFTEEAFRKTEIVYEKK